MMSVVLKNKLKTNYFCGAHNLSIHSHKFYYFLYLFIVLHLLDHYLDYAECLYENNIFLLFI